MSEQIQKIVIVGGGTAGWMAAAALANHLKKMDVKITLIESADIGTIGVGEATVPSILAFNKTLGINEAEFIKFTQATFKLGIEFKDWFKQGTSFFHPFAGFGSPIDGFDFYHCWLKIKSMGINIDLDQYCLAIHLAKKNKFVQPDPNPTSPLGQFNYAFHFDATLYAKYLRNYSEALGVLRIESKVVDVSLRESDGFIDSIMLSDGSVVEGDLFIDCSGFSGVLIEGALKTGYEKWTQWLPCDSAVAVQSKNYGDIIAPYTRSTALSAGWQWRIPLQHRTGNGYVYCSKYISDDAATKTLLGNLEGDPLTQPRVIKFTTGIRNKFWNKNCVCIGLSSGFLEPLESTSIYMIQMSLNRLITFFPTKAFSQSAIAEANRLSKLEAEHVRDFIILHYKANQRNDSAFWCDLRDMKIPESLQHRLELFKSRAYHPVGVQDFFTRESWLAMYNGFNITANQYDARLDYVDSKKMESFMRDIKDALSSVSDMAPFHHDFIMANCRADKP